MSDSTEGAKGVKSLILRSAKAQRGERRHPAEVTADRLIDHLERWFDTTDGALRDEISHVRFWLDSIADGTAE